MGQWFFFSLTRSFVCGVVVVVAAFTFVATMVIVLLVFFCLHFDCILLVFHDPPFAASQMGKSHTSPYLLDFFGWLDSPIQFTRDCNHDRRFSAVHMYSHKPPRRRDDRSLELYSDSTCSTFLPGGSRCALTDRLVVTWMASAWMNCQWWWRWWWWRKWKWKVSDRDRNWEAITDATKSGFWCLWRKGN